MIRVDKREHRSLTNVSVAVVRFRSVFWPKTQNPELDWGQVRRGRPNLEPNYRSSSMGSGSGSEPVRTTQPATVFISKNRKNNAQGRKIIENNRRGGTRSRGGGTDNGGVCLCCRGGGGSGVEEAFPVYVPVCTCAPYYCVSNSSFLLSWPFYLSHMSESPSKDLTHPAA